jgi:hypothetical protein
VPDLETKREDLMMKIKTLGLALVALVALGAVLASSAFATPVTKKASGRGVKRRSPLHKR